MKLTEFLVVRASKLGRQVVGVARGGKQHKDTEYDVAEANEKKLHAKKRHVRGKLPTGHGQPGTDCAVCHMQPIRLCEVVKEKRQQRQQDKEQEPQQQQQQQQQQPEESNTRYQLEKAKQEQ
ncbi:hypothetical protein AWZ03_011283 [Drosophila navojoa]|uniref:Uncharacterized protein n=1 Tax=Drosophila navojoa TaxID=7232 RepID=A0A484B1Y7_DRONA|nr:hypothetical protein AWZ03_011283 [Drosophila navojoa]